MNHAVKSSDVHWNNIRSDYFSPVAFKSLRVKYSANASKSNEYK
jgi:hypothetical protein